MNYMEKSVLASVLNNFGLTIEQAADYIGPPVVGRSGWIKRYAQEAAWAAKRVADAERNKAIHAWNAASAQAAAEAKAKRVAEEAAEEDAAAAANGGYYLEDINPYFYNCGHYPEWIVRGATSPGEVKYATREAAEAAARRKNKKSTDEWAAFMNG